MEKAARAVLRYLYQEYLKAPAVSYCINTVTDAHKKDAVAVIDYLRERNWIREPWVYQNNVVSCRITVAGIEEVDAAFIRSKLKSLVGGLVQHGGTKNLMGIFQHKIEEYAITLDIVYQLEKLKLINILHVDGDINIALTAYGWKFFEKKGKSLFTLMAVA